MKKTEILGIVALLLIMASIAACVQAPGPAQGPAGDTVIQYKSYGGFIMPAYAIQELVVTNDRATFTISSADGNSTERYEKALNKEQFNAIVKVFSDNSFDSYGDRYDEGQNHVTDVGFTDITFTANNRTKTVTTYNVDEYLPPGLVRIREKLRETVEFTKMPGEGRLKALAETWITGSPTYKYDGSGLEFVDYVQQESYPVRHVLTYTFMSSHAGYGNRSGKATAQVMTGHTVKVTIVGGNVVAAVTDEKWDEMGQFIIGSETTLSYRPKQCEKTVWQQWEENSGRVYIRMPADEEIIRHYYASVYEIEVRDVKKIQLDQVTCQACNVCPETYRFGLAVNASEMQPLIDEGWIRTE
ncbi:MAG: hypothetical protein WCB46_09250 [Methanoregula sp.]